MRKNLEKVRVLDLSIKNVSCFENISISFNKKFNFICGANGIGKTSILNIIGASFISLHHIRGVHRNALSSQPGEWSIVCKLDRRIVENKLETRSFYPDEQTAPHGFYRDYAKHIIHLKTNRDFQYEGLHSIDRDPVGDESSYQMAALVGVKQGNIKPWLANRFIFKQIPDNGWDADMIENNDLALKCFSLLDRSVEFSHIDTMSLDIYVKTKHGTIPFEYLSSGFRASLSILLGIIKEIEHRKLETSASEFSGLIMIDELDLHLHPTWQKVISGSLRRAFPYAQFIVTTHSPHMIQSAESEEVIALVPDENGRPVQSKLPINKYGFKGWTVEEILSEIMGLSDASSDEYQHAMNYFDKAIEDEDVNSLRYWLNELEIMLHPSNNLRKLLRIQAAPVLGEFE